jgi:hypothetical protein
MAECRFCGTRFPAIGENDPDEPTPHISPWLHQAKEPTKDSQGENSGEETRTVPERHSASSRIRPPAIALSCMAAIGLALCVTGGLHLVSSGYHLYTNARAMRTGLLFSPLFNTDKVKAVEFIVYGGILAIPGTILYLFVLLGSLKVNRLRGFGWGYTSAALGMVSLFLPCLGVLTVSGSTPWVGRLGLNGAITAGIGVWLMLALNNPAVREAIRDKPCKSA